MTPARSGGKAMCGTLVPAALAGCNSSCNTYVDDAKKLDELREKWVKERCVEPACKTAVVCLPPLGGSCTLLVNTCSDLL